MNPCFKEPEGRKGDLEVLASAGLVSSSSDHTPSVLFMVGSPPTFPASNSFITKKMNPELLLDDWQPVARKL
jgi:hypothetical protein